jgi:ribosomal RNA-processing protein 12
LDALENTMVVYARTDGDGCAASLGKVWDLAWTWIDSDDTACRLASERALCAFARYCISQREILDTTSLHEAQAPLADRKSSMKGKDHAKGTSLGTIIATLSGSIHSVSYAKSISSLLAILTALISRLRVPVPSNLSSARTRRTSAAQSLLADLIKYIGDLRTAKGFEYREKADDVLGMAIAVLGPEVFLGILPLNVLPEYVVTFSSECELRNIFYS